MTEPTVSGSRRLAGAAWILAALAVHVAGRLAAVGNDVRTDSLLYGVSAWRFWSSSSTAGDLILDKPVGQMMLTGWIYHLWPGGPSRISVVPVESAFMLAACGAFWLLSARLFGRSQAGWTTLCFALGHNFCNALDPTTDGLNLNENYTALPLVLAGAAHLLVDRPGRRGLARGLAGGLALTIKPTALAALAAMMVHDLLMAVRQSGWRRLAVTWVATAAGIVLAWVPVLVVLAVRGWLDQHIADLLAHAPKRVGPVGLNVMVARALTGMLPAAFCMAAGLLIMPPRRTDPAPTGSRDPVAFAIVWLVCETAMVCSLTIPALHYCQNLAAPVCLLAGAGLAAAHRGIERVELALRPAASAWLVAALVTTTFMASSMLVGAAVIRARGLDPARDAREFQDWLLHWTPRMPAVHPEARP